MSVISDETTDLLIGFLYNTDWTLLSDDGLTGGQLIAYATLRSNMKSIIAIVTSYADEDLSIVITAAFVTYDDMQMRFADFTSNMTAFQSALTTLIGA